MVTVIAADSKFQHQLRQFRILTIVGYLLYLIVTFAMVVSIAVLPRGESAMLTVLPVVLVGFVLMLAVAMPFVWAAYDKTICPHCGMRIEDGHFYWHGIKCNGPTRRYWKLFFGKPLRCPHCNAEVIGTGRARTPAAPESGTNEGFVV